MFLVLESLPTAFSARVLRQNYLSIYLCDGLCHTQRSAAGKCQQFRGPSSLLWGSRTQISDSKKLTIDLTIHQWSRPYPSPSPMFLLIFKPRTDKWHGTPIVCPKTMILPPPSLTSTPCKSTNPTNTFNAWCNPPFKKLTKPSTTCRQVTRTRTRTNTTMYC